MTARAIISVGRLCRKLQRVSIATSCQHGHAASMSTHTAGIRPSASPGFLPGISCNIKDTSDSGTRNALDSVSPGLDMEYRCPSLHLAEVAILDIADKMTSRYDCPNLISIIGKEIVLPNSSSPDQVEMPTTNTNDVAKHAKNILKIRKRMRKKHRLRKGRKLRAVEIHKDLLRKSKKRDAKRNRVIEGITDKGVEFDADVFMKDILRQAQRGGYRTPLFEEFEEKKNL